MSFLSLWCFMTVLLTLLLKDSLSVEGICTPKITDLTNNGLSLAASSHHLEDTPVTRINLSNEDCNKGHFHWSPGSRRDKRHIVQFSKNHEPFTLCLHGRNSSTTGLSLVHLKGSSQKSIPNSSMQQGGSECIRSHCNHITLLVASKVIPLRTRPHKISYTIASDNVCSRCSDSCMETILCNSDYIFIGVIKQVSQETKSSGYRYKSQVYIEKYIRYNNTYTTERLSHCSRPPTQHGMNSDYSITPKGLVSLVSKCRLREGRRYFIGANLKLGYLSKPRLILGCGQEDIDFMLYQFDKMLLQQTNSCCK